ncbi:MAG: response regulator [Oscillospiraceae bacterium]
MRIIAVDDEEIALDILKNAIKEAEPNDETEAFDKSSKALQYAEKNICDVAFLDIETGDMNGIALAKALKLKNPQINIIFSTGYSEYALEAIEMHASGYITKPVTAEKVRSELDNLRFEIPTENEKKLCIQCFGNFDVFFCDKPIGFKYTKTKELLAYLVDRNGAMCGNNEIISVLWEKDDDLDGRRTYFKSIRRDLIATLRQVGCDDAVIQRRGFIGIDKEKVKCDYYDWQSGKASGINAYKGEYMRQYSWSEFTHGLIL